MQADAAYRTGESLDHFYTPSQATDADGVPAMIPLSNVGPFAVDGRRTHATPL